MYYKYKWCNDCFKDMHVINSNVGALWDKHNNCRTKVVCKYSSTYIVQPPTWADTENVRPCFDLWIFSYWNSLWEATTYWMWPWPPFSRYFPTLKILFERPSTPKNLLFRLVLPFYQKCLLQKFPKEVNKINRNAWWENFPHFFYKVTRDLEW